MLSNSEVAFEKVCWEKFERYVTLAERNGFVLETLFGTHKGLLQEFLIDEIPGRIMDSIMNLQIEHLTRCSS